MSDLAGMPRRRKPWSLRGLVLVVGTLLGLLVALPANAAPIVNERYSGTDSFTDCGGFQVESTFSGRVMIKDATPATDGQFFYLQDNYQHRDVITNPVTGEFVVVRGNGIVKEVQARQVEGTVSTFLVHEAGQPFVVEDSSGRVVLRDRGMITLSWVFDTLGDSAPGGEFQGPVVVRVSGPHPGFEEAFDFCGLITSLIGKRRL
jgi:hypothetical protein